MSPLRALLLQKRWKLIHFLVVLIYGDFWENMSPLTYFVGSVRGFWVGHIVPKLHEIALLNISTSWNLEFNNFLIVQTYGGFWKVITSYMYFLGTLQRALKYIKVPKIGLLILVFNLTLTMPKVKEVVVRIWHSNDIRYDLYS